MVERAKWSAMFTTCWSESDATEAYEPLLMSNSGDCVCLTSRTDSIRQQVRNGLYNIAVGKEYG